MNDVLTEAEYADIIITLLNSPFEISSVTKLVFVAFCVKHENTFSHYYSRKSDFIDVFFNNISLKLSAHYKEIGMIINVVDMLKKSSKVIIDGDSVELTNDFEFKTENAFLDLCASKTPNPITEINRLDAKALLEEVIRYV